MNLFEEPIIIFDCVSTFASLNETAALATKLPPKAPASAETFGELVAVISILVPCKFVPFNSILLLPLSVPVDLTPVPLAIPNDPPLEITSISPDLSVFMEIVSLAFILESLALIDISPVLLPLVIIAPAAKTPALIPDASTLTFVSSADSIFTDFPSISVLLLRLILAFPEVVTSPDVTFADIPALPVPWYISKLIDPSSILPILFIIFTLAFSDFNFEFIISVLIFLSISTIPTDEKAEAAKLTPAPKVVISTFVLSFNLTFKSLVPVIFVFVKLLVKVSSLLLEVALESTLLSSVL